MPSRALREQLSPRRTLQRRARNGWLTLVCVIIVSLGVELAAQLLQPPQHATVHAQIAHKTATPAPVPAGCGKADAAAQQQADAALPHTVVLPGDMVPLHVMRDANGTLVVLCTSLALQASHDALQHAWFAQGWQIESDITSNGVASLTFQRDEMVIFATLTAQATTPPTTQVILTLPQ